MGFAHFLFLAVGALLLIAGILVLCMLFLKGANALGARMRSRQAAERWHAYTSVFAVLAGLAASVGGMLYLAVQAPNRAELRVLSAKLFAYESTRIRIELNDVAPAQRQALVQFLRPLVAASSLEFRYRISTRNGGYTQKATLPSHYRLTAERLEIATGRDIGTDPNMPLLQRLLDNAANAAAVPALPQAVQAQIVAGDRPPVALSLLPQTAALAVHMPGAPLQAGSSPSRCQLAVQGLMSSDHFMLLFRAGQLGVRKDVRLRVGAVAGVLPAREYEIRMLAPVPGVQGRPVLELPTDRTQIYAQLALAPVDLREGAGCEVRLLDALDPAWTASSMRRLAPALAGAVKQVAIERSVRYSPWYAEGDWIAVQPDTEATQ